MAPLFRSDLQLRLLGLLFLDAERWWTAEELREKLRAPRASVHRELQRALKAGILEREAVGQTHRFRVAWESPLASPLRELLELTVGVEVALRAALEPIREIEAAVIYGSFAGEKGMRPRSDIDVLVLGAVDVREVRRAVRPIERTAGREIDVRAYTPAEFTRLLELRSGFAIDIVSGPVVPLVGSEEALSSFNA